MACSGHVLVSLNKWPIQMPLQFLSTPDRDARTRTNSGKLTWNLKGSCSKGPFLGSMLVFRSVGLPIEVGILSLRIVTALSLLYLAAVSGLNSGPLIFLNSKTRPVIWAVSAVAFRAKGSQRCEEGPTRTSAKSWDHLKRFLLMLQSLHDQPILEVYIYIYIYLFSYSICLSIYLSPLKESFDFPRGSRCPISTLQGTDGPGRMGAIAPISRWVGCSYSCNQYRDILLPGSCLGSFQNTCKIRM